MLSGELNMVELVLEAGRLAMGRRKEREVSEAEFLVEVVNQQLMSGSAEGKEFGERFRKLMDKKHI